jgi:hypothetical protein
MSRATDSSKDIFQKLVTQYCKLIGLEDAGAVLNGRPILIDDIPVSLLYSEKQRPDSLIIYLELGHLPEKNRHGIERRLLEANTTLYLTSGSCLTRLFHDGPVVHSNIVGLEGMSPQTLCGLLESLVQGAQQWKIELLGQVDQLLPDRRFARPALGAR